MQPDEGNKNTGYTVELLELLELSVLQIAGLRFCCRPLHCGPETVPDTPLASQVHPYGNMVSWYATKGMYQRACIGASARGHFEDKRDKLTINVYPAFVMNCMLHGPTRQG